VCLAEPYDEYLTAHFDTRSLGVTASALGTRAGDVPVLRGPDSRLGIYSWSEGGNKPVRVPMIVLFVCLLLFGGENTSFLEITLAIYVFKYSALSDISALHSGRDLLVLV
jgi:hypothetical protein